MQDCIRVGYSGSMPGFELLDVIDDQDRVVGKASREECHGTPPLPHRTVEYTLVNPASRSVLVVVRVANDSPSQPNDPVDNRLGFLESHVLAGETYEMTVGRGLAENLGIGVQRVFPLGERLIENAAVAERNRLYLALPASGQALRMNLQAILTARWEPIEQLYRLPVSSGTRYWLEQIDWSSVFGGAVR
jgi:hypothetical protein